MIGTLVKSVTLDIGVKGDAASKAKLDEITRKADELKTRFPEYKLKIDSAAASEKLKVFRAELADATRTRTAEVKVKVDDSALQKFADKMKKGGGPSLLGPALLLAPAATAIGGVAAGAGIGLAGAFTAGAGALAAFGAVAKPVLASTLKASQAVNAAQNTYQATIAAGVPKAQAQAALQLANTHAQQSYNAALAGGANPAKALAAYHLALGKNQATYNSATNAGTFGAKAYAAEQKAIGKAYADMSPQQIALSKQLGAMAQGWQNLKAAETPVVAGALQPWLKSVTDLTKNLAPIIAHVAPVIGYLGTKFDGLIKSSAFTQFRDFIASTGTATVSAAGSTLIDFFKGFTILLPQFDPLIREAVGWISRLGPAFVTWASSQKTADRIQAFMQWFSRNGPVVGGLLRNIGGALKALAPGLATGAATELKVLSDFFAFVARLPPALARPLAETAGALLLLNKLGVFSVGVKFVGAAAGWVKKLLGGATVDLGAKGMQTAGDTMLAASRAMQRAADTMLGGGKGTPAVAGKAGSAAAGGAFAGLGAAAGVAFAGALAGAAIRALGDTLSPSGTFAGHLNNMFQRLQIGALHSFTFGGLEGWLTAHLGMPVGKVENQILGNTRNWGIDVGRAVTGAWNTAWNNTISRAQRGFHDLAGWFDRGRHDTAAAVDRTRQDIASWWNISWANTITRAARGFHDLAGWFSRGRHDTAAVLSGIRADSANWWNITWNNTISRAQRGFHDLAGWFDTGRHNVASTWDTVRRDTARIWDTIWSNTVGRAQRGVGDLGRAFSKIGGAVRGPVASVVDNVIDPLFGLIDDVTHFVSNTRPLPQLHLAGGGRIPGYGGGDVVPALLERGETVVDKRRSRQLAGVFKAAGVPGYASGGFVNPVGLNLRPERVDMGVDYGGSGPLFALGSGTITSLFNRGWPGGGFVGLHLDRTPPGGVPWWYYAENVSPYKIGVGSHVSAGQYIAQATGGRSGIEVGYAAPPGTGNTMASATGESRLGSSHGDPGLYPTGWGLAASRLIASLGGRPGVMSGQLIQGGTPGIAGGFAGIIRTLADIFGGLGSMAKVAIDLAHGDTGGAGRALLGMVHPSTGGAKGGLGRTLLGLPGVLVKDVMKFLVSGVKGFAATQQSAGFGGGGAGPASAGAAQAQAYARSRLGGLGWSGYWGDLLALWNQESGWNRLARNPSSGAYGIPQALPASKMGAAANPPTSSAGAQIDWGLSYIGARYGNPGQAEAHEKAFNWYDTGYGVLPPGLSLSYNGTGRPEPLMPARPGRGGGGNHYTINVHVPPGANMAEVGRVTVAAIQQYEKRSGPGWRK